MRLLPLLTVPILAVVVGLAIVNSNENMSIVELNGEVIKEPIKIEPAIIYEDGNYGVQEQVIDKTGIYIRFSNGKEIKITQEEITAELTKPMTDEEIKQDFQSVLDAKYIEVGVLPTEVGIEIDRVDGEINLTHE